MVAGRITDRIAAVAEIAEQIDLMVVIGTIRIKIHQHTAKADFCAGLNDELFIVMPQSGPRNFRFDRITRGGVLAGNFYASAGWIALYLPMLIPDGRAGAVFFGTGKKIENIRDVGAPALLVIRVENNLDTVVIIQRLAVGAADIFGGIADGRGDIQSVIVIHIFVVGDVLRRS